MVFAPSVRIVTQQVETKGADMAKGDVHVVPNEGSSWKVEKAGGSRGRSFDTQKEAWEAGKDSARREKSEAFLHGRNGQIRERNTYGNDPRSTKG